MTTAVLNLVDLDLNLVVHVPTGGIRQNLFENYYLKNYMHRAREALARALAPRAKVGGISQL
jgi:hypothetical protein